VSVSWWYDERDLHSLCLLVALGLFCSGNGWVPYSSRVSDLVASEAVGLFRMASVSETSLI
jgi:hypothetical protein